MLEKLVTWFVFSVVLALVPLFAAAAFQSSRAQPFDLRALVAQGELLLVAAGICAAATAELFGSSARLRALKLLVGGATIALLLFAAIYFASIVTARESKVALDVAVVYQTSIVVFVSAFFTAGACVTLSKA
jgi:hypothetical protein